VTGVVSYTLLITGSHSSFGVQEIAVQQSVFTPTFSLPVGTYTWTARAHDAAGNVSGYVSPPATFFVTQGDLYFPIIVKNYVVAPDLVVVPGSLTATSNSITLTIRNDGNATVKDSFWVDVYFNPTQTPKLNRPWNTIAPAGASWGVVQSLAPGDTLILTSGGIYYAGGSSSFPAGAQVYAYVDSVNHSTIYGNVQERNEGNNLSGPVVSTVGVSETSANLPNGSEPGEGLPER
jgi:hypothetical protein